MTFVIAPSVTVTGTIPASVVWLPEQWLRMMSGQTFNMNFDGQKGSDR